MVFEIFMSSVQEDGFIVEADSINEAVNKTIQHTSKECPGLFDANGNLKENGFPLVYTIGRWQ